MILNSMFLHQSKAVSAPGKVLVAGGYLVLDRNYTGLVFGLDARIHVVIEPIQTGSGVIVEEIVVRSPQFQEATWAYGYRLVERKGGFAVTQLTAGHDIKLCRNPFIETTLTYALSYISTLISNPTIAPSNIYILADQAYYSNQGTKSSATTSFLNFNVQLQDAHKTGLGSSAALVTSFTAALLSYYLPKDVFDLDTEAGRRILHNLSQASHCAAQGKVGSGFDVASAVYGSNLYRRFSPSLLSALPTPGDPSFAATLSELVQGNAWNTEIQKAAIQMPKGLRLVMCDVDCGSETPGMVKKVLAWRKAEQAHANEIWGKLQKANEELAAELTRLATEEVEEPSTGRHVRLADIIQKSRQLIRTMSLASDVPIEPPQQTALLDACTQIPGVIGGIVPGAGGYDAVVLIIEDNEKTAAALTALVQSWQSQETPEDTMTISKVGILGVREDMVGVKREDVALYRDWIGA